MTAVVLAPPTSSATAVDVVPSPSSKASNSSAVANDANSNQNVEMVLADAEERIDIADNEEQSENSNERQGNAGAESKNETPSASATKRAATSSEPRHKKRPRVSFDRADIVEFEPTIYTTTVTSGGIPVGMSFTERSRTRRRLDSWELERTEARVGRQSYMEEGYLDPTERETILNKTGCDEPTMVVVEAEVNRIIAHRRESNEIDFEFMYGLGEVGDSLVEEDEDEDEVTNQEGDEDDDEEEEEEQGDDEDKEPQEEERGGGGFSSEEEEEDGGDEGVADGSRNGASDQAHP
ncbi:hypothetical protein FI667_g2746, partial [Globisporangium splendens]